MLVGLIEFFPELLDLFLQLLDSLQPRVVIDNRPIGDKGRLRGVGKCAEVFLNEGVVGIDAGYHQAVTIPAYRLFEDGGQFGIAIGHVDLIFFFSFGVGILGKDVDDLPQGEEGFVDVDALLG